MADLTQTAANVGLLDSLPTVQTVMAGEAITQGMPVYRKAANSKYYKADKDAQATAAAIGIAVTPAAANEYTVIVTSGSIDLGATLTVGETYVVSDAGAIAPVGDVASGWFVTVLGTAVAAGELDLNIYVSNIAKA